MDDFKRVPRLERYGVIAGGHVVFPRASHECDAADRHGFQSDESERLDATVREDRVRLTEQHAALPFGEVSLHDDHVRTDLWAQGVDERFHAFASLLDKRDVQALVDGARNDSAFELAVPATCQK